MDKVYVGMVIINIYVCDECVIKVVVFLLVEMLGNWFEFGIGVLNKVGND